MEDKGESSQEGDSSCALCDLGKHQLTPGVCTACPAGQYQDGKGEKSCKQCDVDTYLAAEGKSVHHFSTWINSNIDRIIASSPSLLQMYSL